MKPQTLKKQVAIEDIKTKLGTITNDATTVLALSQECQKDFLSQEEDGFEFYALLRMQKRIELIEASLRKAKYELAEVSAIISAQSDFDGEEA